MVSICLGCILSLLVGDCTDLLKENVAATQNEIRLPDRVVRRRDSEGKHADDRRESSIGKNRPHAEANAHKSPEGREMSVCFKPGVPRKDSE